MFYVCMMQDAGGEMTTQFSSMTYVLCLYDVGRWG